MRFVLAAIAAALLASGVALATTVEVVTADIIRADGKEWRIANIEAPQLDASCAEEKAFGATARAKLSEIMAGGEAEIKATGGHDFAQRETALVRVKGEDVGEQMIRAGMATQRGYGRPLCFAAVEKSNQPNNSDGTSPRRSPTGPTRSSNGPMSYPQPPRVLPPGSGGRRY